MIAPYITREEYQCRHCRKLPPDFDDHMHPMIYDILFGSFEVIREAYGKPIYISSGYRCPLHNSFIGGKPLSAHLFGLALDLKTGQDTEQVYQIIQTEVPDLRVGKYQTFLHIDIAYHISPRASTDWERGARWR